MGSFNTGGETNLQSQITVIEGNITDEVVVKTLSDLPAPSGGKITLGAKHYIFNNDLTSADSLAWPGDGLQCQISVVNRAVWTYTGTDACFSDQDAGGLIELHGLSQWEAPNGLMWNVQAPNFDCSWQATMTPKFTNCKGLGRFEGDSTGTQFAGFNVFFGTYSDYYGGLTIKDNGFQEHAFMFTFPNESTQLAYDGQTVNWTVGETVTGGTSSATGVVEIDDDAGTTGTLTLSSPTGTFQDDEAITGSSTGVAVANGANTNTVLFTTSGAQTIGNANFVGLNVISSSNQTVWDFKSEIDPGIDGITLRSNQTEGTFAATVFAPASLDLDSPLITSSANIFLADSRPNALLTLTGNTTDTVIAAANTPVKVVGTWVVEKESQFTSDTTGKVTYNGINDLSTPMVMSVSSIIAGGGQSDTVTYYIAKNGTVITSAKARGTHDTTDPINTTLVWQETLVTGDFIELYVENNDDTSDIEVQEGTMLVN